MANGSSGDALRLHQSADLPVANHGRWEMGELPGSSLRRWRNGIDPRATEMRILSIGRAYLHLGEALRLEMVSAAGDDEDTVHLQYYIVTEVAPWAVWATCARAELADLEASLRELTPPSAEDQ
jgi:hypothetical protein